MIAFPYIFERYLTTNVVVGSFARIVVVVVVVVVVIVIVIVVH